MLVRAKAAPWIGASLVLCTIVACTVTVAPDEGTITVSNKVFSLKLGANGVFELRIGAEPVQQKSLVEDIFASKIPSDTPASAVVSLDANEVAVVPLGTLKLGPGSQVLSGSAELNIYVGPSTSTEPCDEGIYIGSFHLTFGNGIVTIDRLSLDVPSQALGWILTGSFTLCMEMTADVDVQITVDGIDIEFGPPVEVPVDNENDNVGENVNENVVENVNENVGENVNDNVVENVNENVAENVNENVADNVNDNVVDNVNDNTPVAETTQVPIDFDGAPIMGDTIIDGVEYSLGFADNETGVMEVVSPGATPARWPGTIGIDLADLGLASVDTIYYGTLSGWSPDLPGGLTVATLTCSYAEGGDPTTVDFVTGSNTAEWSYDREEHTTLLGGVRHARPPELFSYTTSVGSASSYTGYSYAGSLVLDPGRTLTCIELTLDPAAPYASLRDASNIVPTWIAQVMSAITLEGTAGTPVVAGTPCTPEPPVDDGFTPATIIHRGSEQIIAGPNVDPTVGTVTPPGYSVGGYKQTALSGDNGKVWFVLYDEFPNVEGDPQLQLWSVNIDGTGGQRSIVPGEDSGYGLGVETSFDGSVCYVDDRSASKMFRATPGAAATEAFAYWNAADGYIYGDVRGQFKISDDATKMVYTSYVDSRFMSVDLTASPNIPAEMANASSLAYLGVNPSNLYWDIDMTADGSRWISASHHVSSNWDPTVKQIMWIGSSLGAGATPAVHGDFTNLPIDNLNITDDGSTVAYCLRPDGPGFNDPNECIVEALDGSSSTVVGDGRTWVGFLVLAENGSRVHYVTDTCCSGGTGIFEDVATGQRIASGTEAFLVDWGTQRLSSDGNTLVSNSYSASQPGVYVLRDGSDPTPGFPSIEDISFRFMTTGEDCSLLVRVTASSPRGVEIIYVNPYFDGVDPTQSVPGDQNPLFPIRFGSFAFTPVEGMENVWEYEIRLTNDVGVCVSDLLTTDYRLRVVVKDFNATMAVFQDFTPAQ